MTGWVLLPDSHRSIWIAGKICPRENPVSGSIRCISQSSGVVIKVARESYSTYLQKPDPSWIFGDPKTQNFIPKPRRVGFNLDITRGKLPLPQLFFIPTYLILKGQVSNRLSTGTNRITPMKSKWILS
jgi:hypothetical protein